MKESNLQLGYVVHVKTPGIAGGQTRSYQMAQALAETGYCVNLYGEPDLDYSWNDGVVPLTMQSPVYRAAIQLFNDFSRANIDVCIERYQFPPFNVGFWVQMLRRKPIVLEIHGFPIDEYSLMLRQQPAGEIPGAVKNLMRVPAAVWNRLQSFIFSHVDCFIVTSDGTKQILQQKGVDPRRITVVYNRVDTGMFDPALFIEKDLRAQFGFAGDEIVFLYAGSLFHEELLLVIEAFGRLIEQGIRARLAIFGTAGSQDQLRKEAESHGVPAHRLSISPAVPHQEMPGLLSAVDVVLAPYTLKSERFQSAFHYSPLKLMEALSMAKPVVTVDAAELRSLFDSVPNVVFVEASSSDSWTDAMKTAARLRNDPRLLLGRSFVEDGYRWIDAAQNYAAVIENLASNG